MLVFEVLELLPDQIFGLLGSNRAVLHTATVSKAWCQLVLNSLHSVDAAVSTAQGATQLEAFLQARELKQLRTLDIIVKSWLPDDDSGNSKSARKQKREQLQLQLGVLTATSCVAPQLQQLQLQLDRPHRVLAEAVQQLLDAATQLTELQLALPWGYSWLRIPSTTARFCWKPTGVQRNQHGLQQQQPQSCAPSPPLLHLSALTALDWGSGGCHRVLPPMLLSQLRVLAVAGVQARHLSSALGPTGLRSLTELSVCFEDSGKLRFVVCFALCPAVCTAFCAAPTMC